MNLITQYQYIDAIMTISKHGHQNCVLLFNFFIIKITFIWVRLYL